MSAHDLIVIGGGPGGYVAAIRAAQLGMKVLVIDGFRGKRDGGLALGGTCLNVGCIPSKALLDSSHHFHRLLHGFAEHGIEADRPRIDPKRMIARKDGIVAQLNAGIAQLFKAHRIEALHGIATLHRDRRVRIALHGGGQEELGAPYVILAAGSVPVELPFAPFDGERILDNAGILDLEEVPRRLGVIGAGVIGLEMGSVWRRLGAEVTILEALPEFLPALDRDMARLAEREFRRQGLDIRLGCRVEAVEKLASGLVVRHRRGESEERLECDRLLVAVGRKPASAGLLAPDCGVRVDARGFVEVDDHGFTGVEGVFAIGDLVRGPMLAHKASEEGVAVAERIAGLPGHVDLDAIPWVIYTDPEIAWVGLTEKQAAERGIPARAGSFPFAASGRALAIGESAGAVKLLAHEKTDRLLGMQIVGPQASELIHEGVLTLAFHGSAEDLARICHAHPTLAEAVHEAALAVDRRAIHKAR
jgi:dihydrolipoamide dehydrogenase